MSGVPPPNHHSESSIDVPRESPTYQKSNDDSPLSGEKTPPSLSPLIPFDWQETDNLSQSTARLNIVDCQKKENHLKIESDSDPSEILRWDSIPLPALERICNHIYNANDGTDMANLALVSHHYNNGVMKFMNGPNNRPGIEAVTIAGDGGDLRVCMTLLYSNLTFYDLASLEKGRFKTMSSRPSTPIVRVMLNGPEDPIIEKVISTLSATIKRAYISDLPSSSYSLCEQLLRSSTIGALIIMDLDLNDTTAPLFLSIASHTKEIEIDLKSRWNSQDLSDPASFVVQLYSMPRLTSVSLVSVYSSSLLFFGLPNSFWENYLNDKLSNGSLEWVKVGRFGNVRRITKAPIGLNPDEHISILMWEKKNSK